MENSESDERPTCPMCLNLAINAMIGVCGHTVCRACSFRVLECPECHQLAQFGPNDKVRKLLRHPRYKDEIAKVLQGGKEFNSRHPEFVITVNDFYPKETSALLELIDNLHETRMQKGNVGPIIDAFDKMYGVHLIYVTFKSLDYFSSSKHARLRVIVDGYVNLIFSNRPQFA